MKYEHFRARSIPRTAIAISFLGIIMMNAFVQPGNAAEAAAADTGNEQAAKFIAYHEREVRPLDIAVGRAWWTANTTGRDEDFTAKVEAQNRLDQALANADRFAELKAAKAAKIGDPLLRRQIDILYLIYLEKQVDPELLQRITATSNEIEKAFNVFRAKVGDKQLVDSEVRKTLKESKDSASGRQCGKPASKSASRWKPTCGSSSSCGTRRRRQARLCRLSRHAAFLNEQSQEEVIKLFDDLDALTREPFPRPRREIDDGSAAELRHRGRRADALALPRSVLPGNAGGLQGGSRLALRAGRHLQLCREFYAASACRSTTSSQRSDLYEKQGQEPARLLHRHRPRRATCACSPTSCRTNTGWARCCTSSAIRSIAARTFPQSLPYVLRTRVAHPDHRRAWR